MNNNKDLFENTSQSTTIIKHNYYKDFFASLVRKKSFVIPVSVLLLIFIFSTCIYLFIDNDSYLQMNLDSSFIYPNKKYLFGTNGFGQNLFYQIFVGFYNTFRFAIIVMGINLFLGTIIGVLWGLNNRLDCYMIFIKGILDSIPMIFFYIIVITYLGNGFIPLIIILILFGWFKIAVLIRNNLIIIRNKDYNVVSKLNKVSLFKRAINNYLPSILPIIFNSMALVAPEVIYLEVTLSYFGFSLGENNISLGKILFDTISKNDYYTHSYLFIIPLIVIFITNICFFYIGKAISSSSSKEGCSRVQG